MKYLIFLLLLVPLVYASGEDIFCSYYEDPFLEGKDESAWNLTAEDFGKAARMELMVERIDYARLIASQEYISKFELRELVGMMYFNSIDFKNLFFEDGAKIKLSESKQKLYMTNLKFVTELEQHYHNFDEVDSKKLKIRIEQILRLQRNMIRGMQRAYIEGN